MATITFLHAYDMENAAFFGVDTIVGSASSYSLSDSQYEDIYTGSFTYDGSANLMGGTASGYAFYDNSVKIYEITGGKYAVSVIKTHLNAADKIAAQTYFLSGNDTATGSAEDDVIFTYAGHDTIDGGAGEDYMAGGLGNDTYIVDEAGDTIEEGVNAGIDTVKANVSYILSANVENLILTGMAANGTGNTLANSITGNDQNNILNGGAGIDTLIGGLGDDTYRVDLILARGVYRLEDAIKEFANQGNDTLEIRNDHAYAPTVAATVLLAATLENMDASATGTILINLIGNGVSNNITGNDGNNTLNGGLGADTMTGKDGDDIYVFDNVGDAAIEDVGEGTDTIQIAYKNTSKTIPVTFLMTDTAYDNIENMTILGAGLYNVTGNGLNNTIIGNASANVLSGGLGNDTLNGGAGNDVLDGGDGDDTYYVDSMGDTITDSSGTDTVYVSYGKGSYTLAANLEHVVLTGKGNTNATGNTGNNNLTGNLGSNTLDGGAGADTMAGGKGNDIYIVDNAGDVVTENLNEGADTIRSSMDFSLDARGANVENLILTGSAITATGNSLNNTITGNDMDNIIDGKGGLDIYRGGKGNDTYHVELIKSGKYYKMGDGVIEAVNQGTDTIILHDNMGLVLPAAVTLAVSANVENFDISNIASLLLNVSGNALNNILTGNSVANTLNGGVGHDQLIGGDGADILIGGKGSDRFYYNVGESESGVGHMDIIKDFTTGDKITFNNASGLTYHGLYGNGIIFADVATAIAAVQADVAINDAAVYFKVGVNGYLYVKGDGDGTGTDYSGTLIMAEKKGTAFVESDIEFNAVMEQEGSPLAFTMEDKVVGSLTSYTDEDTYNFTLASSGSVQLHIDVPTNFYASQPAFKIQLINSDGIEIGEWSLGRDGSIIVPYALAGDYSIVFSGVSGARFSVDPYSFSTETQTADVATVDNTFFGDIVTEGQIDTYEVTLVAGHAYSIDALTDGFLDPKVRIYDETGRQLKLADDTEMRFATDGDEVYGYNVDAYASFIAPLSGKYFVTVESGFLPDSPVKSEMVEGFEYSLENVDYADTYGSTGSYTLNITEYNKDDLITAQLSGASYNEQADFGNPLIITYAFPASIPTELDASWNYNNMNKQGTFKGFSAAQQTAVEQMLDMWESYTGITFQKVDAAVAELKFGWMTSKDGSSGGSYRFDGISPYPQYTSDEDYFLMTTSSVILGASPASAQKINVSTNSFWNLIQHEVGHSLGFEHTANYRDGVANFQNEVLPPGFENTDYSIMSYIDRLDMAFSPADLQLFDIAAAQRMYGVNTSYEAGNTNWEFNSTTTEYYKTIWDGGGNDTLDASGQTLASTIFLEEGAASTIGAIGKIPDTTAADIAKAVIPGEIGDRAYHNVTIAFGAQIENAKGGAGDDFIAGNALDNKLYGNGGSDILKGGDGNDTLYGGAGKDLLYGGNGNDVFVFESTDASSVDVIADFNDIDDAIDVSALLQGFDPLNSAIADFVSITTDGTNSSLYVDVNGTTGGANMVLVATLKDVTGLDVDALYSGNSLIA